MSAVERPTSLASRSRVVINAQVYAHTSILPSIAMHSGVAMEWAKSSIGGSGIFRGGDFGNPSERSERALTGSGLKFERLSHVIRIIGLIT